MVRLNPRAPERASLGSTGFPAVILSTLLIMIGFGLIVPALPLFAKRFGVQEAGIGLLLTVFGATRLVGDLFAGALIDRFGERAMTAIGAVIVGVSSFAAGAAPSFGALVVLRGAGGIGSAFFLGGLMAFLIGSVPAERRGRAMGSFQASVGIGLLIGPLFGGLIIARWSENVPLYIYGVICVACAPLCLYAMRSVRVPSSLLEDAPDLDAGQQVPGPQVRAWDRMRPLLRDRTYVAAIAVSGVVFMITSALQGLIPDFWTDELGRSDGSAGIPFFVMALMGIAVVWHAGSLSDRRGRKYALVPALAVTAGAIAALAFVTSAMPLVVLIGVFGVSSGYMRPGPTAMVADIAPADARGVAVSGYRIAGDIGAVIGPILAGSIAQVAGFPAAFVTLAIVCAGVFVLALSARETAPSQQG